MRLIRINQFAVLRGMAFLVGIAVFGALFVEPGHAFDVGKTSSESDSGTTAEDFVVAKVNGKEITKDFVAYLHKVSRQKTAGALTRSEFVKSLKAAILNRLLFEEGEKTYPDLFEHGQALTDLIEAREYHDLYLEKVAMPRARKEVTYESVLAMTPPEEDMISLRQIILEDYATAEMVLRRIEGKEISFADAAKQYSRGLTASKGGIVGGIKASTSMYDAGVLGVLFALKPGEMTGIVATSLGPSIFYCEDRIDGGELRERNAKARLSQEIRVAANRMVVEEVDAYARSTGSRLVANETNIDMEKIDLGAEALVFKDRSYTLGDMGAVSGGAAGNHGWKVLLGLAEKALRDLSLRDLYIEKFGPDPRMALRRKVLLEQSVARAVLQRAVPEPEVTDADIDAWIAGHPEKFHRPESLELGLIIVLSKQRLEQVQQSLARGTPFESVARTWSQAESRKNDGKVGLVPVETLTDDFKFLSSLEEGETTREAKEIESGSGGAGFYLFKLYRKWPEKQFVRSELDEDGLEYVRGKASTLKREAMVLEYQERLSGKAQIEIVYGDDSEPATKSSSEGEKAK